MSRNSLSLLLLPFSPRKALLHTLHSRVSKRDPSLVPPNIPLTKELLHQTSRVLPRTSDNPSYFWRGLRPFIRKKSKHLKLSGSRYRVQRTRLHHGRVRPGRRLNHG